MTRRRVPVVGGRRRVQGYTLIEVIVAFALLAMALTLLLGSLANASKQVHWADGAGRATLYAQSLLAQVGVAEPLQAGTRQGVFENDRYHWTLVTQPYADPGATSAAVTADGAQLYEIVLDMDWGKSPAQRLHLKTLRLSRPAIVAAPQ
jgi:general secretion pathway protein I